MIKRAMVSEVTYPGTLDNHGGRWWNLISLLSGDFFLKRGGIKEQRVTVLHKKGKNTNSFGRVRNTHQHI
jgi:hypothetical protein